MLGHALSGKKLFLPPFVKGLSARLLVLTVFFVMLAEVLIYAPSIGRFRLVYLEERLAAAHLAILALEATPDFMVSEELELELMDHVGAYVVSLVKPDVGRLMLMREKPPTLSATYDLRRGTFFGLIRDAAVTLLSPDNRVLRVIGPSPKDPEILVEVLMDEAPLREQMLGYSRRILALSLLISLFTAALVYLSLHLLMVRPMKRMTDSMAAFRANPEDQSNRLPPSARSDEIGVAQRELIEMQEGLRAALLQKTRLAALGVAVTKISHDLRNMLATASLVSDRLTGSDDPEVRRAAPTLIAAIDRAVNLCSQTLTFTREGKHHLDLGIFDLKQLVDEVARSLPEPPGEERTIDNQLQPGLEIEGDREQLYRVFNNLVANAVQAGASRIGVALRKANSELVIEISDDGPGLPPRAIENLFQPFASSARTGGTGLGLAIARDVMRAHGGELRLERSTSTGTTFSLSLPVSHAAP